MGSTVRSKPINLMDAVSQARSPSPWDLGNQVLYDLCAIHSNHRDQGEVLAKIWLIGRSYAAAIERRRNKGESNDDFYLDTVAPAIIQSDIDQWIKQAASHPHPSEQALSDILLAHANVTNLFNKISDLDKRSLASKYLHFHLPHLFYIYDTRAVEAIRLFSNIVGRAKKYEGVADGEYRKFAQKCLRLQQHITMELSITLTPRQLDTLLINAFADQA